MGLLNRFLASFTAPEEGTSTSRTTAEISAVREHVPVGGRTQSDAIPATAPADYSAFLEQQEQDARRMVRNLHLD